MFLPVAYCRTHNIDDKCRVFYHAIRLVPATVSSSPQHKRKTDEALHGQVGHSEGEASHAPAASVASSETFGPSPSPAATATTSDPAAGGLHPSSHIPSGAGDGPVSTDESEE